MGNSLGICGRSRTKLFVALLLMFLPISLVSCQNEPEPDNTYVQVPSTNFVFQPADSFQVNEYDEHISMRKPGDKFAPSFLIYGRSFQGGESQDVWLKNVEDNKFHINPQDTEVNGIFGYVGKYEEVSFLSWRAVLSTEQEGIVLLATAHPDNEDAAEKVFWAVLNSVKIQELRE